MYRRHLRMTIAKDLEANKSKSEFVQRIASIPVVYLAWNIAAETYHTIKTSNKFFKTSLDTTEKAAYYFSEPVIRRFERQLKTADFLACRGLETLLQIFPNVTHQKAKLYEHTRNLYEDTVESGLRKYELVKKVGTLKVLKFVNEGTEKFAEFLASPYGEVCELILDFALDAGELYVDYYLPPLGDERPEKLFGDRGKVPAPTRSELLKNRFMERFYKHSLLKFQMIKLRTRYFIVKIYHFSLYNYLVETSALIPELLFATVIQVFTNAQDLKAYIATLFSASKDPRETIEA